MGDSEGVSVVCERPVVSWQGLGFRGGCEGEVFDDEVDGGGEAGPGFALALELGAAGGGDGIEAGLAVGLGGSPLGADPALLLEAVEGGVEGALLDLEDFVGELLDALGDGPAVFGLEGDGLEDEEVEGSLDEIVWLSHTVIIYTTLV